MTNTANINIDIHADDFALSANSDKDILTLCSQGFLDSISILPNMKIFETSATAFKNAQKSFPHIVKVSLHLNFMEGKCCADKNLIPHLVDKKGYFTVSWAKLLLWSYIPIFRKTIQNELATEITMQTKKLIDYNLMQKDNIRYDSHQHPHMIPVVFKALIQSIEQNNFSVSYIRNSNDPVSCYLSLPSFFKTYSLVNIIKCFILNFFSIRINKILCKKNIKSMYLCGVFFSSKMDFERVKNILPFFYKKCQKKKRELEVLFHPGLVLENELNEDFTKPDFNEFHLCDGRKIEYDCVKKIKGVI